MHYNSRSIITSSSGIQFRTSAQFLSAGLPITGEIKELYISPPPLVVHSAVLLGGTENIKIASTAAPGWVQIAAMAASMSNYDSQYYFLAHFLL